METVAHVELIAAKPFCLFTISVSLSKTIQCGTSFLRGLEMLPIISCSWRTVRRVGLVNYQATALAPEPLERDLLAEQRVCSRWVVKLMWACANGPVLSLLRHRRLISAFICSSSLCQIRPGSRHLGRTRGEATECGVNVIVGKWAANAAAVVHQLTSGILYGEGPKSQISIR